MTREDMLAQLMAQARQAEGSDLVTLRAMVEEASELGAGAGAGPARPRRRRARARTSTSCASCCGAWRDAKASAWKAAVDWVVRGMLALLLIGIAVRLGRAAAVSALAQRVNGCGSPAMPRCSAWPTAAAT